MTNMIVPERLRFTVPAGWYRLPRDPAADGAAWARTVALEFDEAVRESLVADLERIAVFAQAHPRRLRSHFVYLPSAVSEVSAAYLSIDVYEVEDGGYERYFSAVTAERTGPSAAYAQRIFEETIAAARAVVVQDFIIEDEQSGSLQERYLAALFPAELGVLIELQITTPDLSLFPDIIEYGNDLAATMSWSLPA